MPQQDDQEGLIAGLSGICQVKHLVEDVAHNEVDWRGRRFGRALALALPATTEEVSRVVRFCQAKGLSLVPQGGNTGLCAGAVPSARTQAPQVILSLKRLNRIRQIDAVTDSMTVEAGVLLQQAQQAASEAGRLFPLSLGAEGSCTIGGNIATNAGGHAVLRYGNMRDLVLGLEVVLPSGDIWHGLRALRKDNTGYDLKQLFIGSEGTLGIITAATLKMFPPLRQVSTALLALPSYEAALSAFKMLQSRAELPITAFELMSVESIALVREQFSERVFPFNASHPVYVLLEAGWTGNAPEGAFEEALSGIWGEELIEDAVIGCSETHAQTLWQWRESITEAQRRVGPHLKHDISLPIACIPSFLHEMNARLSTEYDSVRVINFGHLGDGNLHYNISFTRPVPPEELACLQPEIERRIYDAVAAMQGSFSAEHGVGQTKVADLERYRSELELSMMRRLKCSFDPAHLLNPGKVIASPFAPV